MCPIAKWKQNIFQVAVIDHLLDIWSNNLTHKVVRCLKPHRYCQLVASIDMMCSLTNRRFCTFVSKKHWQTQRAAASFMQVTFWKPTLVFCNHEKQHPTERTTHGPWDHGLPFTPILTTQRTQVSTSPRWWRDNLPQCPGAKGERASNSPYES